jgi:predicted N-acyltransferase
VYMQRTESNECLETNNPLQYDAYSQKISSKQRKEVKSHRERVNVVVILDIVRPSACLSP